MIEEQKDRTLDISHIFSDPLRAISEILDRKDNPELINKILEHLNWDIPEYFKNYPIFYFARHIATPNHETIRMIKTFSAFNIPLVIGQDSGDKYTSINHMKLTLGRMPVLEGFTVKNGVKHEKFKKYTIIDFSKSEGKKIEDIKTLWGEPLLEFHNRLFKLMNLSGFELHDDKDWIDKHGRGNISEHYKEMFALFISHAILVEGYFVHDKHEREFVQSILLPTIQTIKNNFGFDPIITNLYPEKQSDEYWFGYPKEIGEIVEFELSKVKSI